MRRLNPVLAAAALALAGCAAPDPRTVAVAELAALREGLAAEVADACLLANAVGEQEVVEITVEEGWREPKPGVGFGVKSWVYRVRVHRRLITTASDGRLLRLDRTGSLLHPFVAEVAAVRTERLRSTAAVEIARSEPVSDAEGRELSGLNVDLATDQAPLPVPAGLPGEFLEQVAIQRRHLPLIPLRESAMPAVLTFRWSASEQAWEPAPAPPLSAGSAAPVRPR